LLPGHEHRRRPAKPKGNRQRRDSDRPKLPRLRRRHRQPEQQQQKQQQKQQKQQPEQRRPKRSQQQRRPRSLSHFLPDQRDQRDVEHRRWRASRLPNGGDPRTRLLRAVHKLYKDYRRQFPTASEAAGRRDCNSNQDREDAGDDDERATSGGEEPVSHEFDSLSCGGASGGEGSGIGGASSDGGAGDWRVVQCRRRRTDQVNQVLLRRTASAEVWIDAPIALELRLPRVRAMLSRIMTDCPFVTDPTEALAELRAARYNAAECIEYLQEVRPIWEAAVAGSCQAVFPASAALHSASNSAAAAVAAVAPRLLAGLARLRACTADCAVRVTGLANQLAACAANAANEAGNLALSCRRLRLDAHSSRARRLERQVEQLRARCRDEERQRKTAFNELQERLGSVRVFARCRHGPGEQAVLPQGSDTLQVFTSGISGGGGRVETFQFDGVFVSNPTWRQQMGSNQEDPQAPTARGSGDQEDGGLFKELRPLIDSFLDGYNVCFIAYGGEASGKTHTLHGPSGWAECGLVYRSLAAALAGVRERQSVWRLELATACLEIYNDSLVDLGDRQRGPRRLPAGCLDRGLADLFDCLCRTEVATEADALAATCLTSGRRRVAPTALNPNSSRSHLLHLLRVRGHSLVHKNERLCAFLGLMDLAGAENVVKAATLDDPTRAAEAGHINRSLASFNRLFLSLRRSAGAKSVATYRDSRLTQLIKPFVTDHGKCCIIVTVRTDRQSLSASLSSLRFGRDARQVMLGRARRQLV
uniref:Kinesin motor domain-containing protein n=1 Tax=Macrostomum lignano TaxID=282301 RepID=A0A1I8HJT6_9PLAT